MDKIELANWRMHSHRLWGTPFSNTEDALRWFGAMQAQEFVPAKWAIGQRSKKGGEDAIEKLYVSGAILRTHVVRPTWHFVHRDDLRWMLDATRARVHQLNGTYYRKFGVEGATFDKCVKVFTKALKGGNEMNRKELIELLKKDAAVEASGLHMGYILMRAELEAVIVSGSVGGKAPTFAYFDDRVPGGKALPPEEALAELTRRYFTSRGPATLKDYVRWSSLTVAEAKKGLALVGSELETLDNGGRTYFYAKAAVGKAPKTPHIDLVQGYDEYVMSYSESKDVLHAGGPVNSGPIDLNVYLHAVMLDGQVVGHWRLVQKPLSVEAALYRPLDKAETAAMDAAVQRFGDYFGQKASWVKAGR